MKGTCILPENNWSSHSTYKRIKGYITSWKFAEKLHHCYAITYWAMDERIYLYMMALCSNWWWCCTCTSEKKNKQVFVRGITSKLHLKSFSFTSWITKWKWYTTNVYINKRNHYSTKKKTLSTYLCPHSPSSCRATTQF